MQNEEENSPRAVVGDFIDDIVRGSARTLMRFGASARDFADVSRWSFVKAFYSSPDLWVDGHPTAQKAAIKTGVPRALVKELNDTSSPYSALFNNKQNTAYRVIDGWVNDPEFHVDGEPMPLPLTNPTGPTFHRLVHKYGNDVTWHPILKDLEQEGCVVRQDRHVTLVNRTYGMAFLDEDKLRIAGHMIRRLSETTDHNLTESNLEKRRLQRFWRQTRVPVSKLEELKTRITEMAVANGRQIDKEMAAYASQNADEECVELGIATYLYESLPDETAGQQTSEDTTTRRDK